MPKPFKPDKTVELPKFGERIPAEKLHVSKLNVRVDEPFGESEADKLLIENLRRGKTIQPFKARPEGKGFGIYVGRRRFLAKMAVGTKHFVVGQDVLIDNINDDAAREDSLVENLSVLREEINPVVRARKIQDLIDFNMIGIREVGRRLGLSPSTLSEWVKILELSPAMQEAVGKGQIYYKDALTLAKMKPTELQQKKLAEAAETGGRDGYIATLETVQTGHEKRGIPADKYLVVRSMFEKAHEESFYDKLGQLAKAKNMEVGEYSKWVLIEHVKSLM
jgi:ParB/RepB/Spo0J family partition protein